MGIVYKARQRGLNRLVALKTVMSADHAALERFRLESEAAANLRHPGIVSIYDVGDDNGRHFYSMELVEGRDLSDLVRERSLTGIEAASHVLAIAQAMHYAHERGILHRDLKPSNVLIDASGTLKVTDFGLAKRVDGNSDLTGGNILGTPSYMPPEQALPSRGPVGPHSDVYSLGAILYQLLTCRPPFRSDTPLETIRQLLSVDPVAPRLLNPQIPKDLETICLKCLEKDIARRYSSARLLADELQRFLNGEPIHARPIHRAQRVWRWCRRHPTESSSIAIVAAVLFVGVAGITWQWVRAERNLDKAEKAFERLNAASDQMLEIVDDWVIRLPDHAGSQQALGSTLALYEQFLREEPRNLAARRKLAETHHRIADIRRNLSQLDLAIEHYSASVSEYRLIAKEQPGDVELQRRIADELDWLGETLRRAGKLDQAEKVLNEAIVQQEQLALAGTDSGRGADLARSLYNRALVFKDVGDIPGAIADSRRAIQLLQAASENGAEPKITRQGLARCRINLGIMLRESKQPREALLEYQGAGTLLHDLLDTANLEASESREFRSELAQTRLNQGNLLLVSRNEPILSGSNPLAQCEASFQEAIELLQALADEYPSVPEYRNHLANSYNGLGSKHQVAKEDARAAQAFSEARRLFESLVATSGDNADLHSRLAITLANIALLTSSGNVTERIELLRRAVEHQSSAMRLAPRTASYAGLLRRHRLSLSRALLQLGDHAAAVEQAREIAHARLEGWKDERLAASLMAKAVEVARNDPQLSQADRAAAEDRYGREAVECLNRAVETGLIAPKELESDDFSPLSGRTEFQTLLTTLRTKTP